jgi:hypothetical protein
MHNLVSNQSHYQQKKNNEKIILWQNTKLQRLILQK